MKKYLFIPLLLVLINLCLLTTVYAQASRGDREEKQRREKERQQRALARQELDNKSDELHALDNYRMLRPEIDSVKERELEIKRNLKELVSMGDQLVSAAHLPNGCQAKETADLANKIVKLSKLLRRDLDLPHKNKPVQEPLPVDAERSGQVINLATSISDLIIQLKSSQNEHAVDASLVDQTSDMLNTIENQAYKLRALVRGKY